MKVDFNWKAAVAAVGAVLTLASGVKLWNEVWLAWTNYQITQCEVADIRLKWKTRAALDRDCALEVLRRK
jgi:hypothetical protein